jgi:CarD family transcriptional regulator, regulator of rRNA transcription
MASVKKTMKSSETKQAKQAGTRRPKAKASHRSAESKARKAKAAAVRALAARKLAAAKKLAAQKSAQKAKAKVKTIAKTKTAAAASSRSNSSAAATPVVKNKKKVSAATRASAAGDVTHRAIKKAGAAARRGKTALTGGAIAKPSAAPKPVKAARKGATSKSAQSKLADAPKKTPAIKVSRRNAAKPAAARMAVELKTRATQKPTAGKDAAAALLALRNVARLAAGRKRAAAVNPVQHAVNSSNLNESNKRMTGIKEAKKKMGTASGLADTCVARPPAKDTAAGEAVNAKGAGTPLDRKTASKLVPPLIGDRTVALAPVAANVGQLNLAEARPTDKQAAPAPKPVRTGSSQRQLFKPGEFVVYPAHGVGQIIAVEEQEVAGFKLELYVISFIKDKMILKVPTPKVASVGMRKLADASAVKGALNILAGRARVKRTMWSRRAQEYEAKINSGDLNAIAEVVRDLYRSDTQPEQSYSERQLYEAALDRMTREIVVVQKLTETESLNVIEAQLQKGPHRGKTEEIDPEEAEIEEAA